MKLDIGDAENGSDNLPVMPTVFHVPEEMNRFVREISHASVAHTSSLILLTLSYFTDRRVLIYFK